MLLEHPEQLNPTQKKFVLWNAERLSISESDSFARLQKSWNTIEGGYGGMGYRSFNVNCHDVFQVLYGDGPGEVMESYQVFAPLHFLRMLSYPEPSITQNNTLVQQLSDVDHVTILDFGCGLAQLSRSLVHYLTGTGRMVKLFLADIPTLRKDFLLYLCKQTGINATFLDCSKEQPIPMLPVHNICIATEFFEHVYDPVSYFDAIDGRMTEGGILVTNSDNHNQEFMHVTPDLGPLREALNSREYEALRPGRIFRKTRDNLD